MSVRLELKFGTSSKFWECFAGSGWTIVRYGKIGGPIASQQKTFPSQDAALKFAQAQTNSKLKKGYVRSGQPNKKGLPGPVCAGTLGSGKVVAPKLAKLVGKKIPVMKAVTKAVAKPKVAAMKAGSGGPLAGEVVCFTGDLQVISRKSATDAAIKAGAKVGGLTKATTILVVGAIGGSAKLDKAGSVTQWTADNFMKKVKKFI
eukprot:TRINITY_DN7494_c0_g3_i1.p1 TRINITY_DN7494_c0_g3~~TRINITY_DN7494_c0_g3_i1.p1  ORF type:complete len:203 (-),score=52.04 TRINITY_DN7494_c0_g3_i1:214-822(-)